jgi:hypothetical protein
MTDWHEFGDIKTMALLVIAVCIGWMGGVVCERMWGDGE